MSLDVTKLPEGVELRGLGFHFHTPATDDDWAALRDLLSQSGGKSTAIDFNLLPSSGAESEYFCLGHVEREAQGLDWGFHLLEVPSPPPDFVIKASEKAGFLEGVLARALSSAKRPLPISCYGDFQFAASAFRSLLVPFDLPAESPFAGSEIVGMMMKRGEGTNLKRIGCELADDSIRLRVDRFCEEGFEPGWMARLVDASYSEAANYVRPAPVAAV